MSVVVPTLQFVYASGLGSFAIALKGGVKLSHVDAVMDDGSLLGARWDNPKGYGSGVKIRPYDYAKWEYAVRIEYPRANQAQQFLWRQFLMNQRDRPYDWRSIVGFALQRDWRERDSWFCSELVTAASEHADLICPLYEGVNKVDPAMSIAAHTAAGWMQC